MQEDRNEQKLLKERNINKNYCEKDTVQAQKGKRNNNNNKITQDKQETMESGVCLPSSSHEAVLLAVEGGVVRTSPGRAAALPPVCGRPWWEAQGISILLIHSSTAKFKTSSFLLWQTDRDTGGQKDRQSVRHTDKQTYRQTDRQTRRQADMQTDRQIVRQINRHLDIHTYIHTYIQTDSKTDSQTDIQTDLLTICLSVHLIVCLSVCLYFLSILSFYMLFKAYELLKRIALYDLRINLQFKLILWTIQQYVLHLARLKVKKNA